MTAAPSPPAFDYDSIPVGYYDEVFRRGRGLQSKWHHLKFARVRAELPPSGRLLDVACGPGTFLGTLPAGLTCLGLDIAKAQIDYAQGHYAGAGRSFSLMAPGELPVAAESIDVVTIVELIEHISMAEATRLLTECRRVLRPGGKLVLTTPNYACLWPLLEYLTNRVGKVTYEDQHITKYRAQSLRALLRDSGFGTANVETCLFSAPFFAAFSWSLADTVARIEPSFLTRRCGHLLIGSATKS